MTKVYRKSDEVLTPLGMGTEENFRAVLEGRSQLRLHEGTFGVKEPFFASLFDRDAIMAEALKKGIEGYSFFETIMILTADSAISKAGISASSPDTVFVFSTIKGNVDALEKGSEDVLLSSSAERVSRYFGNPNSPITVSNACISGLAALIQGQRILRGSRARNVVVVGAEVQSKFIVTGFQSLKALSPEQCKPFDAGRQGLNLGEAAAAMVLSTDPSDWELVEGAVRNDANHISGPSRTGEGSYNCLRAVVQDKEELAFISAHGTSTAYNDEMESIAIERAGLLDIPVGALKGYYGHTMGAAGILETAISMKAVENGTVIATRGFTGNLGVSRPVKVSNENGKTTRQAFVKLLSGFGGVNAALLCRRGGGR
ncbi:MAG: beta-ketoacyl synthase [Bacteroidales bacterium]|nr:beta-ketoacyl synthase [Bacteroidales bacterium]